MRWVFHSLLIISALSLCGCAGFSLDFSRENTPHYRHFASINTGGKDNPSSIDIRKRNQMIQAEKLLYQEGKFSASAVAGRHRQQRWTSGLYLNYEF